MKGHRPHLELASRVAIPGARTFVANAAHLFVAGGDVLSCVDVSTPAAPRVVGSVTFRRSLSSIARRGDVVYVVEPYRAIDLVDVRDPAKPDYFDCIVAFGRDIEHLQCAGDTLVAEQDEALVAWDIRDPRAPVELPKLTLRKAEVAHITERDGVVYAACRKAGVVVVGVEGGALVERSRTTIKGFTAEEIFATEHRLYVVGESKGNSDALVILDRKAPEKILWQGKRRFNAPTCVVGVSDASDAADAIAFVQHYRAVLFGRNAEEPQALLSQYETSQSKRYVEKPGVLNRGDDDEDDDAEHDDAEHDDGEGGAGSDSGGEEGASDEPEEREHVTCMETTDAFTRRGSTLLALQRGELIAFSIRPDSPLAALEER